MTTIGRQHPDEPHGANLTPEQRQAIAEHARTVDAALRDQASTTDPAAYWPDDRHDQGDTLRAAQETAVRDVLERLTTIPGLQRQVLAGEVVDAVLAAGRPQDAPDDCGVDHTTNPGRTAGSVAGQPLTRVIQRAARMVGLPEPAQAIAAQLDHLMRDQLDQAEARGYAAAVAELRGVVQRTGSPAARHAADYLEAVGPEGAGRITAYVHRAADGTETVLDPAEISIVRQAVGPGTDQTVREAAEPAEEQYPGQCSIPKNGCPVCGGPIQVAQVDTGTKPYHDFIPGRWDCPRGCDPRQAVTEDADG